MNFLTLPRHDYDLHQASLELWECRNCHSTLPLSIHGKCSSCGSDAVISVAAIRTKQ